MKKIAFFINSFKQGGAEKVVSLLIKKFAQKYEVHLILLENEIFFDIPSNVKVYILNKRYGILSFIKSIFKVKTYLEENNIEILFSNLFKSSFISLIAKKLFSLDIKVYVVTHTELKRFRRKRIKEFIHIFLIKYLYRYADKHIAVSYSVKKDLETVLGKKYKKIIVIHNPIDVENIMKLKNEEILDFNFLSEKIYIIFVGRLNKIKRIEDIIKALEILKRDNIELILIGKEEDFYIKEYLSKKVKIHYLGPKINPYKYISKSDLLILPSESESFGNVIVESFCCSTPVISSDCGGPREIISENIDKKLSIEDDIEIAEYGILYPVGGIIQLSRAIEVLISDKILYSLYKKNVLERAYDFSIDNIFKFYERLISEDNN